MVYKAIRRIIELKMLSASDPDRPDLSKLLSFQLERVFFTDDLRSLSNAFSQIVRTGIHAEISQSIGRAAHQGCTFIFQVTIGKRERSSERLLRKIKLPVLLHIRSVILEKRLPGGIRDGNLLRGLDAAVQREHCEEQ